MRAFCVAYPRAKLFRAKRERQVRIPLAVSAERNGAYPVERAIQKHPSTEGCFCIVYSRKSLVRKRTGSHTAERYLRSEAEHTLVERAIEKHPSVGVPAIKQFALP